LSDPKMDATNVEIERDTEIIERVAKTNPENIETLASDLALKAEKLTDEKTKEIVQEENEKKDNEPITEDTLKKKVEDAQEKYDFAEAEGNVNDIGELKNDLNAKKELLNVLIATSLFLLKVGVQMVAMEMENVIIMDCVYVIHLLLVKIAVLNYALLANMECVMKINVFVKQTKKQICQCFLEVSVHFVNVQMLS